MTFSYTTISRLDTELAKVLGETSEQDMFDSATWVDGALIELGNAKLFTGLTCIAHIKKYAVKAPCGIQGVLGLTTDDTPRLELLTGSHDTLHNFQMGSFAGTVHREGYKYNGGKFIFNFTNKPVLLSYTGLPLDDIGYPLIPDDPRIIDYIVSYIIAKKAYAKYLADDMTYKAYLERFTMSEFRKTKALIALSEFTLDEITAVANIMRRPVANTDAQRDNFVSLGADFIPNTGNRLSMFVPVNNSLWNDGMFVPYNNDLYKREIWNNPS